MIRGLWFAIRALDGKNESAHVALGSETKRNWITLELDDHCATRGDGWIQPGTLFITGKSLELSSNHTPAPAVERAVTATDNLNGHRQRTHTTRHLMEGQTPGTPPGEAN